MERNIISEIRNIKRLINIVEDSDSDCEKRLEDKGWVVDSPKERKVKGLDCGDDGTNLKRLLDYFDQEGVTNELTTTHGKNCYTELHTKKVYQWGSKSFFSKYLTFFESGHVNYVIVFDPEWAPKKNPGKPNEEEYWQYMFRGQWECDDTDPSKIKAVIKNMNYCCSFVKGDTSDDKNTKVYKWKKKKSDPNSMKKMINKVDNINPKSIMDLEDFIHKFK
jgi:hypothetical protein